MRVRLAVPALLLTALAVGCGGDADPQNDEASDEVTTADFCESYASVEASSGFDETKTAIADMQEQGLPEDASAEAQEGFDILAGVAADAKDEEDASKLGQEIDQEGQAKVQEFFVYAQSACAPSEAPSDEAPSDEAPSEEDPAEDPSEESTN